MAPSGCTEHYLRNLADVCPDPWTVAVEQLVGFLARDHWAAETRKSARSALRGFYSWSHGRGYLEQDPSAGLPSVSVPAGRPRPTPEHLVRQLMAHPDPRIGLMVMLAAFAGLRCAEIARVHRDDLVGDDLTVLGKGGKVRGVPILSARLLERIEGLDGWAFPNGLGGHLSPGHVSKLVSDALPGTWTAHTLRHRFGTVSYAGTRDLLAVQTLLGHSRPETTQRYVLIPDDSLRAAARAAVA